MTLAEWNVLTKHAFEKGVIDEDGKRWLDNLPLTTLQGLGLTLPGAPVSSTLIVRRFAPVLSQMDARLLQFCLGDGATVWGGHTPRAKKLAKCGLLERTEGEENRFKTTPPGVTVLERFYHLGWLERPKKGTGTKP